MACTCDFCARPSKERSDHTLRLPLMLRLVAPGARGRRVVVTLLTRNEKNELVFVLPGGHQYVGVDAATERAHAISGTERVDGRPRNVWKHWHVNVGGTSYTMNVWRPALLRAARPEDMAAAYGGPKVPVCHASVSARAPPPSLRLGARTAAGSSYRDDDDNDDDDGKRHRSCRRDTREAIDKFVANKREDMRRVPPERWTEPQLLVWLSNVVGAPELGAATRTGPMRADCTFRHPSGAVVTVNLPSTAIVYVPTYRDIVEHL